MLTRLTIANYKALRSLTLELRPITVLVGANGVGKTSVLEAVELLALPSQPVEDDNSAFRRLEGWAKDPSWSAQRAFGGKLQDGWSVRGDLGAADPMARLAFGVEAHAGVAELIVGLETQPIRVQSNGRIDAMAHLVALAARPPMRAVFVRPTLAALRAPSYAEREVPMIQDDGYGIPSVLANLASVDPAGRERIIADLRAIIPAVRQCRTPRHKLPPHDFDGHTSDVPLWGHRLELELDGVGWVPAEHLSEGTLRALAYLCALSSATDGSPFVFLADDFDAGLHPSAQAALVKTFRAIRERRPEVQFLCTTHSPFVLDAFADEEVIVCARGADGAMRAMSLARHPEWSKWKAQLRAGEFWSSVGEDWVLATPETAA